jgi:hypothetical protein
MASSFRKKKRGLRHESIGLLLSLVEGRPVRKSKPNDEATGVGRLFASRRPKSGLPDRAAGSIYADTMINRVSQKKGMTMTFFRTSQRPVSRRTNFARPTLEGCESRQLMSGLQASVDLSALKKGISADVPVVVATVSGTVNSEVTAPTASTLSKMIKHGI